MPPTREKVHGKGEKILVVEDDRSVRNVITEILQNNGYVVVAADSGVSARQIWDREGRDIALLLTDMVMPGGVSVVWNWPNCCACKSPG